MRQARPRVPPISDRIHGGELQTMAAAPRRSAKLRVRQMRARNDTPRNRSGNTGLIAFASICTDLQAAAASSANGAPGYKR